jgi:hypothetical protein
MTGAGYNLPSLAMDRQPTGEAGMHTVEMLERLKDLAESAGYCLRHEWLGGVGGGACEFAGRKWIFIDLSLPVVEQLDQIASALKNDPTVGAVPASVAVQRYLELRPAA